MIDIMRSPNRGVGGSRKGLMSSKKLKNRKKKKSRTQSSVQRTKGSNSKSRSEYLIHHELQRPRSHTDQGQIWINELFLNKAAKWEWQLLILDLLSSQCKIVRRRIEGFFVSGFNLIQSHKDPSFNVAHSDVQMQRKTSYAPV